MERKIINMPIYEYRCSRGHKTELFCNHQNVLNSIVCDICGHCADKIISPCSIVFKGSGFSITDKRKELEEAKTPI